MLFAEQKIGRILTELNSYIQSDAILIENCNRKEVGYGSFVDIARDTAEWEAFGKNERWGGKDQHCWFSMKIIIPNSFSGKTVLFEVETGREGLWDAINPQFFIYVNGKLIQGLDVNHQSIILCEKAISGNEYQIALLGYSGMTEGLVEFKPRIAVLNREIQRLYYNIKMPYDTSKLYQEDDIKRIKIFSFLNQTLMLLDLRQPFSDNFFKSITDANAFIEEEFYNKYCGKEEITALCVGATHIDVAWLWTLAQTREKAARSFSTVINLMKSYPEYTFMCSQPQLYKFVKEDHPELYGEIKQRIKEGRWEAEGGMWLEADCNLSSGESFVRQILFGKRFFKTEFGIESRMLWLPDVFGYSAALPQILKKSGIDFFMTTKISWNEFNKMPNDSFFWRGMDGTEILTHFITTTDPNEKWGPYQTAYNGRINPTSVLGAWNYYRQKELHEEVLICYGYGDGGGGPTIEYLENARRLEKGIPGCPRVKHGKAVEYFENLSKSLENKKNVPKWDGELYLEHHRGTYTSMARNKKYNRRSEFQYQNAEAFSILNIILNKDKTYPQEMINKGWEIILLNQFHDILPGSSIKEVYEDSRKQYEEINKAGDEMIQQTIRSISDRIDLGEPSFVVFNPLGFDRSEIVSADIEGNMDNVMVLTEEGREIDYQIENEKAILFHAENVPANGYKTFKLVKNTKSSSTAMQQQARADMTKKIISNNFFDIKFDQHFHIVSIYDKVNAREVIKAGERANVFQVFEDKPFNFDAWNIDIYYQDKCWEIAQLTSAEIIENGPVRTKLQIVRQFLLSEIVQEICVYKNIPRIDFKNRVDWKEKQLLLKVAFPVDIHTNKATYEIQYGNVERPTHWNTSWDYAKFEVCAHKWVDLSEGGYGVSLLNDCKYGHDIKDGIMRLTLIKSATDPNPYADRELHEFSYAIFPHANTWKEAKTVQMAYGFNNPMYVNYQEPHSGILPVTYSLINLDCDNVIIEVVKKAEDSEDIILRMYEFMNKRTQVSLTAQMEMKTVQECTMMEEPLQEIATKKHTFSFKIEPYEIKTFKITV